MGKCIFFIFLIFVSLPTFADVIRLKSGKTVEGKIIEKTDEYVKIDFLGVKLKYYFDEIEKLEEGSSKIIEPTVTKDSSLFFADKTTTQLLTDTNWNYSFKLLPSWSQMSQYELKSAMVKGFKPKEDCPITIQLQVGRFSETDTIGKKTLVDLINTYLKPHPDLKREFIKPITLRHESGYLIRYVYNTTYVINDKESVFYLPVRIYFDYYFFSPLFFTEGKDRRAFCIELSYPVFEEVTADIDSAQTRQKVYQLNSYYKNLNRRYENICWEAKEIINSFQLQI
ncbi:MAG: hypothetical protein NC918_05675 [Candidatus Omnitrophica bacterium]|nr:hypothetical protein [Candidatus Omnitrophota bacterium]